MSLIFLVGCQPSKKEEADVGLGNLSSSEFLGPVLASLDIERPQGESYGKVIEVEAWSHVTIRVTGQRGLELGDVLIFVDSSGNMTSTLVTSLKDNDLVNVTEVAAGNLAIIQYVFGVTTESFVLKDYEIIDLTATNHNSTFEYSISSQPSNGTLLGVPPNVIYVPDPEFIGYDRFYFSATNSLGQWSQATVSVNVTADSTTIYLRSTGNDSTAIADNSSRPYLTAQKAVEAAIALSPSKLYPVVINVGSGNFGNVTLTADFGSYVSWSISGLVAPVIGDILATGANGGNNVDGSRGWDITINADPLITFGNITSQGGDGGAASTRSTHGGKPGSISIKGVAGNVLSIPGSGQKKGAGTCLGQSAGNVLVEEDSEVGYILAEGFACDDSGVGGNIVINGEVSGDIFAGGGASGEGGHGGSVWITGSVTGTVYANGGSGDSGGDGGFVGINGSVSGDVIASGGAAGSTSGGNGGTVEVQAGSTLRDINVSGGDGVESGGQGGIANVFDAALRHISANGGAASTAGPVNGTSTNVAGSAGSILLDGNAFAYTLFAVGGDCNDTLAGDGGVLSISTAATYDSGASSVAGGSCNPGLDTGAAGSINVISN